MTTSYPANAANLFAGTPVSVGSGYMTIVMKTNRYYTDGSLLSTGNSYTVTKAWGRVAVDRGWASGTGRFIPNLDSPHLPTVADGIALRAGITPGLPKLRNAIAATLAGTADTYFACEGDSTDAGGFASGSAWAGCRPLSSPTILGNLLSSYLPISQDSSFGRGENGVSVPVGSYDPKMSASTVNWSVTSPSSTGGTMYRNDTNEVSTLSMQGELLNDTGTIWYYRNAGMVGFSISVNGGQPLITIAPGGADGIIKQVVTFAPGIVSLDVTRALGAGNLPIAGMMLSHSTIKRVHIWNWGSGGSTIANWNDVSAVYSKGNLIALFAPHGVSMGQGINDALAGTVIATFLTTLQAVIDRNFAVADVIGIMPNPTWTGGASAATQNGLYRPARDLYAYNGIPIVDYNAYLGTWDAAVTGGYFLPANDHTHPGTSGYSVRANLLFAMLRSLVD